MTDSLERFLTDLHFDVPAGLVDRAKGAAAIAETEALPGRRERVRRRMTNRDLPLSRHTELAAAIAAILLAAIVVGSFAYIRAINRPHTVAPPITTPCPSPRFEPLPTPQSPSPTPLSQSLDICPTTPVIAFTDPANSHQIDGMTWDGQRVGKITEFGTPAAGPAPLLLTYPSNPAGTLFVAFIAPACNAKVECHVFPYFFDRSGRVVATSKGGPYSEPGVGALFFGMWADDESHYCQVVPFFAPNDNGVPATLQLTTPGGAPRDVARVGTVSSGENNVTAAACSVLADRAVVVEVNPYYPWAGAQAGYPAPDVGNAINQYWVVQLSTGRLLWRHDVRGTNTAKVVASRDGRYVAEVERNGASTIYGPSGFVVGHLTGSVQNFSWDGSLAVVKTPGGVACHCTYGPVSVIRWSSGTVIWIGPVGEALYASQPEPGGSSFAIETAAGNADQMGYRASVLYVVSSDGHVLGKREGGRVFL